MCSYYEQQVKKSVEYVRKQASKVDAEAETRVIRPTVLSETITAEGSHMRHWALVPAWSRDSKLKYATFNARAEGLADKPAYRDAWKRSQRCLIPAVRYCEYPVVDGKKARHNIALASGEELMIAGLWSDWRYEDQQRDTFTMITTAPLAQIAWVHNRSPLMLTPDHWEHWLTAAPEECLTLLAPQSPGELVVGKAGK